MNLAFKLHNDKDLRDDNFFAPFAILTFWQIMTVINLGKVLDSIERLRNSIPPPQIPTGMVPFSGPLSFPIKDYEGLREDVDLVCSAMETLGFASLLKKAQKLQSIIKDRAEGHTAEEMNQICRVDPRFNAVWPKGEAAVVFQLSALTAWRDIMIELKKALPEELSAQLAMVLPSTKIGYFDGSEITFSEIARERFQLIQGEMNEAGKCFALGRYAACVFHLMRVMEQTVRKLGMKFDVPNTYKKTWGKILRKIKEKIEAMSEETAARKAKKQKYGSSRKCVPHMLVSHPTSS